MIKKMSETNNDLLVVRGLICRTRKQKRFLYESDVFPSYLLTTVVICINEV
jgi:hypothetical protein